MSCFERGRQMTQLRCAVVRSDHTRSDNADASSDLAGNSVVGHLSVCRTDGDRTFRRELHLSDAACEQIGDEIPTEPFICGTARIYVENAAVIDYSICSAAVAAALQRDVKWVFSANSYRTAAEAAARFFLTVRIGDSAAFGRNRFRSYYSTVASEDPALLKIQQIETFRFHHSQVNCIAMLNISC
jgi:hypothetical protein